MSKQPKQNELANLKKKTAAIEKEWGGPETLN